MEVLNWTSLPDPPIPQGNNTTVTIILAVIGLFGSGSIIAFMRLRKEGPKIVVEAAEGAVVVQSSVIKDLRTQIDDLRKELNESKKIQTRVRELEQNEELYKAENARLKAEVADLRIRIADLESGPSTVS